MTHNDFRLFSDDPPHEPTSTHYAEEVGVFPTFQTPEGLRSQYEGVTRMAQYNQEVAAGEGSVEAQRQALLKLTMFLAATYDKLHSAQWRKGRANWWSPQTVVTDRLLLAYLRRGIAGGAHPTKLGKVTGLIFGYGSQVISVEGGRDGHFPCIFVVAYNNETVLEVLEIDTGGGKGEAGTSGGATLRAGYMVDDLINLIAREVAGGEYLGALKCKLGVVRDAAAGRYLWRSGGDEKSPFVPGVDSWIRTSGNPSDLNGVDREFEIIAAKDQWHGGDLSLGDTDWSAALRRRWDVALKTSPFIPGPEAEATEAKIAEKAMADALVAVEMIAVDEAREVKAAEMAEREILARGEAEARSKVVDEAIKGSGGIESLTAYIDGARGIVSDAVERAEARKVLGKKGPPTSQAETGLIKGASADNARRLIRLAITPHPVTGEVENVLLIGHTGTGKTSLIEEIAKEAGRPFSRLNLNGQTGVDEFVGRWSLQNGSTIWIDGILPIALREGHHLLLDEANAALPEVNMILQAVLDHARQLRLAEKDGEVIQAHPEFRCYASMNPTEGYPGTKDLNPALASRFTVTITVDYPTLDIEAQVLTERTGIPLEAALIMGETARAIRAGFAKGTCLTPVGTRDLLAWARMAGRMNPEGRDDVSQTILLSSYRATVAGRGGEDEAFLITCLKEAAKLTDKHETAIKSVTGEDLGAILRRFSAGADDIKRSQEAAREAIEEATARAGEIFAEAFKKRDEAEAEAVTRQAEVERLNGQLDAIRASLADYILQGFGSVVQGKLAGLVIPSGPPPEPQTANGADYSQEPREERFTASGGTLTTEGADEPAGPQRTGTRMTVSANGVDLEF